MKLKKILSAVSIMSLLIMPGVSTADSTVGSCISGHVYLGDVPLKYIKVSALKDAYASSQKKVASTKTDKNGKYTFCNLQQKYGADAYGFGASVPAYPAGKYTKNLWVIGPYAVADFNRWQNDPLGNGIDGAPEEPFTTGADIHVKKIIQGSNPGIFPKESSAISHDDIVFKWPKVSKGSVVYSFSLMQVVGPNTGKEVFKKDISTNSITVGKSFLNPGAEYYWNVVGYPKSLQNKANSPWSISSFVQVTTKPFFDSDGLSFKIQ